MGMSQDSSTRYRILRDDLVIDKVERGFRRTFIVSDPQAGSRFEFSSREMELIELLSEQAIDSEQVEKIIERSSKSASKREFSRLLNRLISCNLMATNDAGEEAAVVAPVEVESAEAGAGQASDAETNEEQKPALARRGRSGRRGGKLSRRRAAANSGEADTAEEPRSSPESTLEAVQFEPVPTLAPEQERPQVESKADLKKRRKEALAKRRRRSSEKRGSVSDPKANGATVDKASVVDLGVTKQAEVVGAEADHAADEVAPPPKKSSGARRRLRSLSTDGSGFKQWSRKASAQPAATAAAAEGETQEKSVADVLARWFWPLKYLLIAAPTLLSFALVYLNWQSWPNFPSQAWWLGGLLSLPLLALTHAIKQLTLMTSASYFGARGIALRRGSISWLPYWHVDLARWQSLPWITQVWVVLAALASQCLLIAGAVAGLATAGGLLWQGLALGLMLASWLTLALTSAPLGSSDANRLLQTFFESLMGDVSEVGGQVPGWQRGVLVTVHAACMAGLLLLMAGPLAGLAFSDWQVVGALLGGSLACYGLLRFFKHLNQKNAQVLSVDSEQALQTAGGLVVERQHHVKLPRAKPALLLLGLLLVVPWLPYQLDVAGEFSVLPFERQEIHTQVAGLIDEVYFDGGETVRQGEVIARLEGYEYEKDARITEARIAEAQAELAKLLNSPRPEEVELARKSLEVAKVRARFSEQELARYEELYRSASVSLAELESMRQQKEVDAMKVLEEQANLELVLSGAHPQEIAAMEAEIERYQAEARYYRQQLERTHLRMPFNGRILTLHLKQRVGQYLNKGDLFAEVEKSDDYLAEVLIAEYDAALVSERDEVRLKSWVYPDHTFVGRVVTIDPVVIQGDYGSQVRLVVSVENGAGKLGSGMTGMAKIGAEDLPVWEVFSRMVVRFFSIEVWSWIP